MGDLQDRLANQPAATLPSKESATQGGVPMRTLSVPCSVGKWTPILPKNTSRAYLSLVNRGGDLGPGSISMAFDSQNKADAVHIDRFNPERPPINAINIYAESAYGDTVVLVEVVEG